MATIVLVHGVWMDASSWCEVIPALQQAGHTVHGVQLPLSSFEEDVTAVKRVLARAQGEITLVGHSYGGAVISAIDAPSVKKLVYIAAFAPDAGEVFGSLLAMNPPAAQVDLKPDKDGLLWIDADGMHDAIAHDVPRDTVKLLAAVQKPYAAKLFEASLQQPAWKTRKNWYLLAQQDRILNPKTQHTLAQRIDATVHEVSSSHMPLFSKPESVVEIIHEAANASDA